MTPRADIGNIRETFFANHLMRSHEVTYSGNGDFLVNGLYTFEVGGKNKKFDLIKDIPNSYLAVDGIETGFGKKIRCGCLVCWNKNIIFAPYIAPCGPSTQ